ncbi:Hypothetical protein R9X50_00611700 [Acrodontium crateriforme]|uniref:Uncharacterized protein n=1 Tax=Acrodontium crateriforme TaxID=150365 RepID=A0AAQ3RBZ8_9PEZI|nr:Hypothetical protein R9X50_00611700 [Acrodontium crateriforme]
MVIRRPSVCLSCRTRQLVLSQRRMGTTTKQRMIALAREPPVLCGIPIHSIQSPLPHPSLETVDEALRKAKLALDELVQLKDFRLKTLSRLSNPWPININVGGHHRKEKLPEANAGPIPHAVFVQRLKAYRGSDDKEIRRILREQLLRCTEPKDVYRIVAVVFQTSHVAPHLANVSEAMVRAFYRCREKCPDPAILRAITNVIRRFQIHGLAAAPELIRLGMKFAARCRSLKGMKYYLKLCHEGSFEMNSNVFRAVIAKFSVGSRGLGEIRNGRWKRSELAQVLIGFDDMEDAPITQQYHLGTFLDRSEWQYLHGWIVALSRCRLTTTIWDEWKIWKQTEARVHPRILTCAHHLHTTRERGDYWFIEQMAYAGGIEQAWSMLEESRLPFDILRQEVKHLLLDRFELAGKHGYWNDGVREELVQKLDTELAKIENHFGVRWEPSKNGGAEGNYDSPGHHVHFRSQEQALELLSAEDWRFNVDYGFPYETPFDELGAE